MKPIVKTYYDALEEGTILGRKCLRCGHIEFPPFLCCNACGCLDTEWVDLTNMRGVVKQALPTKGAFGDPEFRTQHGDYFAVEVEVPGVDPFNTSLLHVDYDKYADFDKAVSEQPIVVKPLLIQDEDEAAAELVLANLAAAIAQLSPIQARRLHARYALKKKYREIAADEGVTGCCAAKSVTSAVTKLQKFFIKNGWMPKEA